MKKTRVFLGCLVLGFSAIAAEPQKTSEPAKLPNLAKQSRVVVMHPRDVIEIDCRLNAATMIALPEGEEALVVQGGDAAPEGTWRYQTAADGPARRYVGVKPSVAGSTATLHIITNHNTRYSFIVREVSNTSVMAADVTVEILPSDELAMKVNQPPVLVSAEEANRYKQEAAEAGAKLEAQKIASEASMQTQMNRFRADYSKQLDHNYRFDRLKAPFHVTDISTDGTFTYVSVDPQHTRAGAVYTEEGKKHQANLPNFTYDAAKGVYTITGRVERGYLSIKDARLDFARIEEGK